MINDKDTKLSDFKARFEQVKQKKDVGIELAKIMTEMEKEFKVSMFPDNNADKEVMSLYKKISNSRQF